MLPCAADRVSALKQTGLSESLWSLYERRVHSSGVVVKTRQGRRIASGLGSAATRRGQPKARRPCRGPRWIVAACPRRMLARSAGFNTPSGSTIV